MVPCAFDITAIGGLPKFETKIVPRTLKKGALLAEMLALRIKDRNCFFSLLILYFNPVLHHDSSLLLV